MKKNGIISISLLFFSIICFGQQDSLKSDQYIVLSVNLNDTIGSDRLTQNNEVKGGNLIKQIKFLNYNIKNNVPFKVCLIDTTENCDKKEAKIKIIQSPNTINEREYTKSEFEIKYSKNLNILKNRETLIFQIFFDTINKFPEDSKKTQQIFEVKIYTKKKVKANDSYLMISAIKSVYGVIPESELFDLNVKFRYTDKWFSMLSMDIPMLGRDSIQSNYISEAMLNINRFLIHNLTERDRSFFIGAGMKIFDTRLLYGVHCGSIELNGPFYSSYVLLGYYLSIYGNPDDDMEIKLYPRNMYIECAFIARSEKIDILKNLRIKVGFLTPLKFRDNEKFNYRARVVLEFPIGGIFRY